MQNYNSKFKIRFLFFLILFFTFSLLFFNYSFSYSPYNTHPALTEEMAKFFNAKISGDATSLGGRISINNKEIEWLRKGAIEEDEPPRWINHFYDPVHKVGWTGKHFGSLSEEEGYKQGADMAPKPAIASIDWVENQEYQSQYGSEYGNQTWQKALFSYANNDKESAFIALGHILHLIEDLSVPDHTRNDSHAGIAGDPGSPYEDYAKEYTNFNKLFVAEDLKNQDKNFYDFNNIKDYFEYLANYTNNNFFSEDTIGNEEFREPDFKKIKIISEEIVGNVIRKYLFFNGNYLSWFKKEDPLSGKKIYTTDDKYFVLPSYRSRLFPEAVLVGASVLNQFFKEAEYYKKNPELLEQVTPDSYQPFIFNLKRAPKLMAVNTSDYYDMHYTGAKVGVIVLSVSAWNKTKQLAYETEQLAKETFFKVKSSFENGVEQLKQLTSQSYLNIKSFFEIGGSQQAGLPIIELNKNISNGIQNSETIVSQSDETVLPIDETNSNQSVSRDSLNERNSENGQNRLNNFSRNEALEAARVPSSLIINNQSRALETKNSENQFVSQKNQNFNFQSINAYSPGFGGGQASAANADGAGNSQSQEQNSSSQNSASNQGQDSSTNQNSEQNNNASSTDNSGGNGNNNNDNNNNTTSSSDTPDILIDTIPPLPPQITSPENLNQIFTISQIIFQGIAEASSTLLAKSGLASESTTTVSSQGNWLLALNLEQGTTTIDFFAVDDAGNKSSSTQISVFVDSIKPAINNFQIAECANSISVQGETCLIATTTLTLIWSPSDGNNDLDSYELSWSSENPGTLSTTSTSTILILNEGEHNFSLRAKDKSGNWSDATTTQVEISTMPVVINEIAWMGTDASGQDEWIELYNRTSKTVNLNNAVLYSEEMKPYIALSNSIGPYSYYLIERTNDEPVSDITADLTASFGNGLKGSKDESNGEPLYLVYSKNNSTTTFDYVPTCGATWCSGSGYFYKTMERVNPSIKGSNPDNWFSNIGYIKNGKDKSGKVIYGTPKARNSANYLLSTSNTISKDIKLTKNNSPYFIYDNLTLPKDKNLAIEPGVVIKLLHPAYFFVEGNFDVAGKENDYITFTSFYDDEYGGDLDKNSSISSPSYGDWRQILLLPTSSSTINYTRFRYGGSDPNLGGTGSMLKVLSSTSSISNSIFEYSKGYGLELIGVNTAVLNNIFQNNNADNYSSFGLYIENGSPKVISNTFKKNRKGINIVNSDADIEQNSFSEHSAEPIYAFTDKTDLPVFKNNSGQLNLKDGIFLKGITLKENSVSTAYANPMPYVLDNSDLTLNASSTLTIETGSIFKSTDARINVYGNLETKGSASGDVQFIALNNYAGGWYGIQANPGAKVVLSGTTIKHGGKGSGDSAGLYSNNADVSLNNALFEDNLNNGLVLKDSKSLVKNSEFKNHNLAKAVAYYNSEINLENTSFKNNWFGIYADMASILGAIIQPIIFENNASSTNRLELFL